MDLRPMLNGWAKHEWLDLLYKKSSSVGLEAGDDSYSKLLADAVADFSGHMLGLNNKSTHNYPLKPHRRCCWGVYTHKTHETAKIALSLRATAWVLLNGWASVWVRIKEILIKSTVSLERLTSQVSFLGFFPLNAPCLLTHCILLLENAVHLPIISAISTDQTQNTQSGNLWASRETASSGNPYLTEQTAEAGHSQKVD